MEKSNFLLCIIIRWVFFQKCHDRWGSVIIWGAIKLNYWGTGRERQWVTKNAAKNVNMRSSFLYYLIISLFLFKILSTGLFLFFSQDSFFNGGRRYDKKINYFFLSYKSNWCIIILSTDFLGNIALRFFQVFPEIVLYK